MVVAITSYEEARFIAYPATQVTLGMNAILMTKTAAS
jgi:hypothetical protein